MANAVIYVLSAPPHVQVGCGWVGGLCGGWQGDLGAFWPFGWCRLRSADALAAGFCQLPNSMLGLILPSAVHLPRGGVRCLSCQRDFPPVKQEISDQI